MARNQRKPAADKAVAQNTAPEAGGTDASKAEVPSKPAEDPTPPDGDGQVIAQAPGGEAPVEPQANQPAEDGVPSPVSGPTDEKKAPQAKAEGVVRVRTVSKAPRRRAGRAFGPEPVEIVIAELSDDEIAALLGDPYLAVEVA